jgi:two-component SAPR family response regulator
MINCIFLDKEKKSRDELLGLLRKISGLHLMGTYAGCNAAYSACKRNKIHILFLRVYSYPVTEEKKALLEKINELGVQIILLSTRIRVGHKSEGLHAADFVMLPTSNVRLWKSCLKALKLMNPELNIPRMKTSNLELTV